MIHSSMREILASFVLENDGSISPVSESSEKERIYADECLTISTNIMVTALSLLIDHFGLSTPNEFAEFCDEYRTFVNGKSS